MGSFPGWLFCNAGWLLCKCDLFSYLFCNGVDSACRSTERSLLLADVCRGSILQSDVFRTSMLAYYIQDHFYEEGSNLLGELIQRGSNSSSVMVTWIKNASRSNLPGSIYIWINFYVTLAVRRSNPDCVQEGWET